MKLLHSMRWRLQLWSGLLLVVVLAGFVFLGWRLQRATQFHRLDQDLDERISVIAGAIRDQRLPPPQDREGDRPPGGGAPRAFEERLSPRDLALFENAPGQAYYYAVWQDEAPEPALSSQAPSDVPRPERGAKARDSRMRGGLRERFHFVPPAGVVLVGRDISADQAGIRRFAWLLASAGLIVLAFGLAGGWWISSRALRPIEDISSTAARISTGDLATRIPTTDADSELGGLIRVLNETFARLDAAFARQARFTADASHELRTPVSVILTQTQSALVRERDAADYRESLAACQRAAQRMRRLIESLLTLARLDSGEGAAERGPCDLGMIAGDTADLLRPLAEEHRIQLDIDASPAPCRGNAEQLGQIASNLLSNAIAYNHPGGSVRVETACRSGWAVLIVSDTGQGIAAEDIPHIFERFYRADKTRAGGSGRAGLGLAIVKAIAEGHGGSVEARSELDAGSILTVRLPMERKGADPKIGSDGESPC